jgi:dipeptidyl aminopeptidase/acylaminoacyl peptidase
MAGNVKEWCWTETGDGMRFILGGGWNEPAYQFHDADARSPWDRSPLNGIRLMRHVKPPGEAVLRPQRRLFRDYAKEKPVSDEVFAVIRGLYSYERRELNPKTESSDESQEWWKREKVSVTAAYGDERVPVYLFLPKTGKPPYQVVVYCPGASALRMNSSAEPSGLQNTLDVIIKSGRAVAYPVYFGMYERRVSWSGTTLSDEQRREQYSRIRKDLGRTIDYLETRPDIDSKKLAYMGTSFGASHGVIWSTMEDRIRVCVYQDGGFFFIPRAPEVDALQFAPRMKKPVLLLSGRYDFTFPLETSSRHLFRLLGTPEKDKRHVIFETAHDVTVMRADFTREVLNWLDKYLGKVE